MTTIIKLALRALACLTIGIIAGATLPTAVTLISAAVHA